MLHPDVGSNNLFTWQMHSCLFGGFPLVLTALLSWEASIANVGLASLRAEDAFALRIARESRGSCALVGGRRANLEPEVEVCHPCRDFFPEQPLRRLCAALSCA